MSKIASAPCRCVIGRLGKVGDPRHMLDAQIPRMCSETLATIMKCVTPAMHEYTMSVRAEVLNVRWY